MFIDSHAHIISEFYDDINSVIIRSNEIGVKKIINCADSLETSKEVLNLSNQYKGLYPTVGIHPSNIDSNYNNELIEIEKLIQENKSIVAIGEIGLDYYNARCDRNLQKEVFEDFLCLAEKYSLGVIIHSRDAHMDTLEILKRHKVKGIIHCFSGSYEIAKEYIKLGFLLGIGGVLTFKNSKLSETISKLDLNNFVLETDSPFLSPHPYRGEKNGPYNIPIIAKKLCEIKNLSEEELCSVINSNLSRIFDI